MRTLHLTALSLLALSASALAWAPKLDAQNVKPIIDSAYDRLPDPISTLLSVDLSVKDGKFPDGSAVKAFRGDMCLATWLTSPTDYARNGSRPVNLTLTGQADEVFVLAQQARDTFSNLSVENALKPRDGMLPEGHLRAYLKITGLGSEKQRNAYDVVVRAADGKLTKAYRRAFVSDWQKDEAGRWTGSMVYYFDAAKAGVTATSKLDVLIRTEADSDCVYQITADLAKFN